MNCVVRYPLFFFPLLLLFFSPCNMSAQSARLLSRSAAKSFLQRDYATAVAQYSEALAIDSTYAPAIYGLAASLYSEGKYQDSGEQFLRLAGNKARSQEQLADVMHNMGNLMMKQKQYAKAVEAYKQALIHRPEDDQTRYNYTLAKKLMQKQRNSQQNQQQQNNQQNSQQKSSQDPPQQQGNSQSRPEEMDQERAKQLLDAFKQDEEKTRERIEMHKKQEAKNQRNKQKKNW
ncbi:MAG: tetratricopeptide repeat protein [Porphyromonas sp.]|nr:tetratricopeptide repeat protein [Porphyromonas sp.]